MPRKKKIDKETQEEIDELLVEYWDFYKREKYPKTDKITKILDSIEKEIRKLRG